MKRIVCLSLLAASLAGAVTPVAARDGWNAAGAVLGAAGGFALGATLANPYPRPVYLAPPAPVYVARPRPVYVESVDEGPVCYVKRRRYVDEFGDVIVRKIRVCE